jgi:hypothetical protein
MMKKIYFLMFIGFYAISSEYIFMLEKINTIPENILKASIGSEKVEFEKKAFKQLEGQFVYNSKSLFVSDEKNYTAACITDGGNLFLIGFYNNGIDFPNIYQDYSDRKPSLIGINKNVILMMKKDYPLRFIKVPEIKDNMWVPCKAAVEVGIEKKVHVSLNQQVNKIYSGGDGQFYLQTNTDAQYLLTIQEKPAISKNSTVEKKSGFEKETNNVPGNPKKGLSNWRFAISGLGIVAFGIVFFIIKFKSKFLW